MDTLLPRFAGNRSALPRFDQNTGQSLRSGMHVSADGEGCGTDETTDLGGVEAVLRKHYHDPDVQAARIVLGAVAAHDLEGQPVWMMIVAPPGSMKTELAEALADCEGVHLIDQLTPRTFLSGQIQDGEKRHNGRSASLLHRIGSGIIVMRDFSTILELRADDVATIMSQLRCIHDGAFTKEVGTSEETPSWRGRITCIVCATPAVDGRAGSLRPLGERFMQVRPPRTSVEGALRAMNQDCAESTTFAG